MVKGALSVSTEENADLLKNVEGHKSELWPWNSWWRPHTGTKRIWICKTNMQFICKSVCKHWMDISIHTNGPSVNWLSPAELHKEIPASFTQETNLTHKNIKCNFKLSKVHLVDQNSALSLWLCKNLRGLIHCKKRKNNGRSFSVVLLTKDKYTPSPHHCTKSVTSSE